MKIKVGDKLPSSELFYLDQNNEVKKIDLRKKIESLEHQVSRNLDEKLYSELLSLRSQLKGG